ncbi:hypothetical protein BHM03_00026653 [Ensete ventricosum]|nr:hypothetical protein BHM03_00026653 [Ensete ventricosum]
MSKRRCLYKPRVDGGEGSLLILLLPEPSDLTPLGRFAPFCLLTDQVGMASTPSFSISNFSSSLSSPVPPPREERHRSSDSSENQLVPKSSSSGVMTGAEAKVLQALEISLSGFPGVASDFSYPSPGQEFHDSVVCRDHRPKFIECGLANDGVVRRGERHHDERYQQCF